MLVEDQRVVARAAGLTADAPEVDLGGRHVLPAFVDAHCHILPTGLDLQKLHLGACESHEDVLDRLRDRHLAQPDGWLLAVHYDQTRYAGGHLSRQVLDAISATRPILLRHVNGHAGVANSAALDAAGVHEGTADPSGGSYGRDASGHLTGVLLELAHEHVARALPNPTVEEMTEAILVAGRSMADFGIGCASDMMTGRFDLALELEAYRRAAERGCPIRIRLYVQWAEVLGPKGAGAAYLEQAQKRFDPRRLGIAGLKIFADGAIGSATAAIYGRYSGEPAPGPRITGKRATNLAVGEDVSGQLIYSPDRLRTMVEQGAAAGFQVAVHSIGDYATDLVLEAFAHTDEPSRHRIEHAMLLSDDQIARMADVNPHCTFQPEFLLRFAHSYRKQLGPERAAPLKRARSVLDAGIRLSLSSDRPIVSGDPWAGILAAENRPEGFDPTENILREEALMGTTVNAARANGDLDMGHLDPGGLCDFQLFEENPWTSAG